MSNRSFKEAATCTTRYVSISDEAVKLKTKSEGRARRGGGEDEGKKSVMREKRGNPASTRNARERGTKERGPGLSQVRATGAAAVKISSISRVRVSEYW